MIVLPGAAGEEAEGAQPQGRHHRRALSRAAATVGPAPKAPQQKALWFCFRGVDVVLRIAQPLFPARLRQRAIDRAVAWVSERLNGEDGLGAIFPAMANSVMMFDALGYPDSHPQRAIAQTDREAPGRPRARGLLPALRLAGVGHRARLPCAARSRRARAGAGPQGLDWLAPQQILDVEGDWVARRPTPAAGRLGVSICQSALSDVDDTAVVAMAMDRMQDLRAEKRLSGADRASEGMDRGHAEQERRLGRVRRRQRI